MKLRITYLWSLIILRAKFPDAAASISAASICCSNQKCSSNLLQNCMYEKLRYWYIFTCSIDLEGYLFDSNNGMPQIAAYLQHIYCKWQFPKNHKFNQDETQDNVSLPSILPAKFPDGAATRSAAATCRKIA